MCSNLIIQIIVISTEQATGFLHYPNVSFLNCQDGSFLKMQMCQI